MRWSRLRAGLLLVVAFALVGIGVQVWRSIAARAPRSLEALGVELLPEVAQHIRNFRRVKVKDGRTEWEITAEDARYFEKSNEVVVRKPELTMNAEDGRQRARLTGSEGRLVLRDREVESVTITGAVVLWIDELQLTTDNATYDRTRDLVTAPGAVTIDGEDIKVHAVGMEVDVTPQRIRLLDDVHTVLQSDAASTS